MAVRENVPGGLKCSHICRDGKGEERHQKSASPGLVKVEMEFLSGIKSLPKKQERSVSLYSKPVMESCLTEHKDTKNTGPKIKMTEVEDQLWCLRQGGWPLERYVENFLKLSNRPPLDHTVSHQLNPTPGTPTYLTNGSDHLSPHLRFTLKPAGRSAVKPTGRCTFKSAGCFANQPGGAPAPKSSPEGPSVPEFSPERASVSPSRPERAPVPKSRPERAPVPKSGPERTPVPTSGPERAPVHKSGPERAPVPTSGPERAPVPKSGPERTPIPTSGPERAPVPTSGPERAPVPKSGPERTPVSTSGPERDSVPTSGLEKTPVLMSNRVIPKACSSRRGPATCRSCSAMAP
ncbi:Mucin-22 [Labeo rohita]|uniref:Mucin-22 n=1 Tax=Labeo rohita TaxID=84645 RepID=A0ABQ8LY33_LABRO|nr:Mucin-22 [Labeo rohita]